MSSRKAQQEFVIFDKSTPLMGFVGADNFAAEDNGKVVSFTIGEGITLQPEGEDQVADVGGQRGRISYIDLLTLQQSMVPAAIQGAPGKMHRTHQVTPEEALVLQDRFDIALGMAQIAQENKRTQDADLHRDM